MFLWKEKVFIIITSLTDLPLFLHRKKGRTLSSLFSKLISQVWGLSRGQEIMFFISPSLLLSLISFWQYLRKASYPEWKTSFPSQATASPYCLQPASYATLRALAQDVAMAWRCLLGWARITAVIISFMLGICCIIHWGTGNDYQVKEFAFYETKPQNMKLWKLEGDYSFSNFNIFILVERDSGY